MSGAGALAVAAVPSLPGAGSGGAAPRPRLSTEEEEELDRRRQDEEFERGVYIAKLTARDFEQMMGMSWKVARVKRLDLSAGKYKLESLSGLELLDKNRLNHLAYIDLSDNRLNTIDYLSNASGFDALVTLIARRNVIIEPHLQLKRLVELNLSNNVLLHPPDLSFLPCLEVLILANNRMSGSFQAFKSGARIKHLDLAHNRYECCPSELHIALEYLGQMKSLVNLRLYGNPFVACFKEYQVFVVKRLSNLVKLDDLRLGRGLRRDIDAAELAGLEVYDDAYRKRWKEFQMRQARREEKEGAAGGSGFARLSAIIEMLEEILDDPSSLQRNVVVILDNAVLFTSAISKKSASGSNSSNAIEDIFWNDVAAQGGDYQAVASRVVELIVATMERHESVRYPLIETLGRLTGVCKHGLGAKCMAAIGRIMLGSEISRHEAAEVLGGIVLNNLKDFCLKDMHSPNSKALIAALNNMLQNENIKEEVADGMKELLPILVQWVNEEPRISEGPHCVKLLAHLTETETNAREVASEELAQRCVGAIDSKSIAEAESLRDLYTDVLNLSENLIIHGPEHVVDKFVVESTHVRVIARASSIIDGGRLAEPIEADTLAKIFNFVAAMMHRKQSVLRDCCDSFHILELLYKILMMHSIDPMILRSACNCLTMILQDKDMYNKYAGEVVESLQMVVPLLDFLDGKRFRDLYKRAMRHGADAKTLKEIEDDNIEVPPLTHMSNTRVSEAFLGIIGLVAFFAQSGEDGVEDAYRAQVNDAMSRNNREQVLLRLLLMPNDDIKLEVMQCIIQTPVDQISPEEMGMIIKSISDTRNIGEGRAEMVLALLVKELGRLVQDPRKTGRDFRQTYAQIAIAEVFETLHRNAQRNTHGSSNEEQQKLELSVAIVSFLRACSQIPSLRRHMRNQEMNRRFPEILKLEEELHSALVRDVALEQSWIGRSLENCLSCLKGPFALDPNSKVLVRVLSRIADILEGHTDAFRPSTTLSLQEIAAKELHMWPDRPRMERRHRFLDDDEWTDRAAQAKSFVRLGGIAVIRELLSGLAVREAARQIEDQIRTAELDLVRIVNAAEMHRQSLVDADAEGAGVSEDSGTARKMNGRAALMTAIQGGEPTVDEHAAALFASKPEAFRREIEIFADVKEKKANRVYAISAFLRILHALVVVPPCEECRFETVKDLRQTGNLVRLIAIVQQVPCLSCEVASKLLRLMHHVMSSSMDCGIGVGGVSAPRLENYRVLAVYVREHAEAMMHLLRLTKDRCLDASEHTLGFEMARFMATLMSAAPVLAHGKESFEVHKKCIAECVEWLVEPVCIKLFIGAVLYDMQMDNGGGARGSIHRQFVQHAYQRVGMKEEATRVLVRLLVRCPSMAYDVLEIFCAAEVFENQTVRPCYMSSLLYDVSLGKYAVFCERFLREKGKLAMEHHVHQFELVDVMEPGKSAFSTGILCATTQSLFLLTPPEAPPTGLAADGKGRWEPCWEDHKPRVPSITWECEYRDILRVYRCYGTQLLVVEWCEGSGTDGNSPRPKAVDAPGASRTTIAFHSCGARDDCALFLHRRSGPTEPLRAQLLSDPCLRREVVQAAANAEILAASVALAVPTQFGRVWQKGAGDEPRLFVLTEKAMMDFSLDMTAWLPPKSADVVFDDVDDFMPSGIEVSAPVLPAAAAPPLDGVRAGDDPGEAVGPEGLLPQLEDAGAERLQRHMERVLEAPEFQTLALPQAPTAETVAAKRRTCGFGASAAKAEADGGRPVLTLYKTYKLPPKDVAFETGPQAELSVKTGDGSLSIRFYDDAGREAWRRGLAYVVAHAGGDWERV